MSGPDEGRPGVFAAFAVRSYRWQWGADLLSAWAAEMETLILAWFVLIQTGSAFLTALVGALRLGGTLLSPAFGVLADRVPRRSLLLALRAAYLVLAAALAGLGTAALIEPWHVLVIAAVAGVLRPVEYLLRQSLIADTVPAHLLTGALGFARTTVDSARVVGALLGATLLASIGIGPAYLVVSLFYVVSLLLTLGVSRHLAPREGEPAHPWRDFVSGFRHIRASRVTSAIMWLAFLVNLTAFPLTHGLLPIVARTVFDFDEIGLGRLMAAAALGGLAGSLLMALALGRSRPVPLMLGGTLAWYATILVFTALDSPAAAYAALFVVGLFNSVGMVAMSVVLMSRTPASFRGRVMGVRMLAVYGLPVGLLVAGALIDRVGVVATVSGFAAVGVALTAVLAMRWRTIERAGAAIS